VSDVFANGADQRQELASMDLTEETLLPEDPKRMFGSHSSDVRTKEHITVVRAEIEEAAEEVFTLVPRCPERTKSLRHLELASFYAHAALVREGIDSEKDGGFVEVDRRRRIRSRVEDMAARVVKLAEVYLCQDQKAAVALVSELVQKTRKRQE
jgi:hypothetical protein